MSRKIKKLKITSRGDCGSEKHFLSNSVSVSRPIAPYFEISMGFAETS